MKHADIAMYRAKAEGIGFKFYQPALDLYTRDRLLLETQRSTRTQTVLFRQRAPLYGQEFLTVLYGSRKISGAKDGSRQNLLVANDKLFKIDHPLNPAKKYLLHASVESDDRKNIYDGVVTLSRNGKARIRLPQWFQALNKTFRYQLTPIGAPAPDLRVAREIHRNRFEIAGGKPGQKVSWQVTGIRHDRSARKRPFEAEIAKSGLERGRYLPPELYGKSEKLSLLSTMSPAGERTPKAGKRASERAGRARTRQARRRHRQPPQR